METLNRKKVEAKGETEKQRFRNIQHVIKDLRRDRKLLHKTRLQFNALFEKPKESKEELDRKQQASFLHSQGIFANKPQGVSEQEKLGFFDELVSPREQEIRNMAKELGLTQEHCDKVKKLCISCGKTDIATDIDRAEFDKIAKALLGDVVTQRPKVIDECWKELAPKGGGISFKDFLSWTAALA